MDRPGISELASAVFIIAIVVAAAGIVLNIGLPQIETMEDTAAIENSINSLKRLDTAIQNVATGGRYSKRQVDIHFERGEYGFNADDKELYYELETESPIISTHATRFMGPVRLGANADVTVRDATVDGAACHMLENKHIEACIEHINNTEAGSASTDELLVHLHNKATNTDLNGTMYVQINGTSTTRSGVENTTVDRYGTALSSGRVTAQVSTTNHGDYNVTYELLSGADFLAVRADAANVTVGLQFTIDSRSEDTVYIDGIQRSDGVYDTTNIDFGYGIGTGTTMMGGIVAGSGFSRVGYDSSVTGGFYEVNVTNTGDSIFLVPFTPGNINDVEDRENLIKNGVIGRFFNYPEPNFAYELGQEKTVRAALSYEHILLDGFDGTLSPGTYQLIVENNGVSNGQANVSVNVK